MRKGPIAIQLFSLREETEKDFAGTLQKIAQLGYAGVEFAGYGNMEAPVLKRLLDELGLKAAGAHVGLNKLESELDNVILYQKEIGNHHIICPFLPEKYRTGIQGYREAAKRLNDIGRKCAEQEMVFSYHNHDFELEEIDGVKPLDILLEGEHVNAELDVYWLQKAGEVPSDWVKKYNQKISLLHLKDMTTDGRKFFAELGAGGVNLPHVIEAGKSAGVQWFIVEQDESEIGALESAKISVDHLRMKGLL